MNRRFLVVFVGAALLAITGSTRTQAQTTTPLNLTLSVADSTNTGRQSEPVTSGVPIPADATTSSWALFHGATEVPLQTTLLPGQRTPWLLLDFQSTQTAGSTENYTLKQQAPTVSPAAAVVTTTVGSVTDVTTGPLKVEINTSTFNLFDGVWYDTNHDGQFAAGERIVNSTALSNLTIADVGSGTTLNGRGQPTLVSWEDVGPLRSTLRVDGVFQPGATTGLTYTARLTFYAGRSDVAIEYVLHNSSQNQEQYVKLSSARLNIGATALTGRLPQSGGLMWANLNAGGGSFEFIPAAQEVSTSYDPAATPPIPRTNAIINVDQNGGLIIPDLSYHGGKLVVDFEPALSAAEQTRRTNAATRALFALAPGSWYSDQGAFGSDHFGTYEDEQAAYQKWGWIWPNPANSQGGLHTLPPAATYYPSWSTIDSFADPEADEVWQDAMMFTRVGLQNYKDRLDAMDRYMKWEWAYRTDGFHFAWNDYWDGPHKNTRLPVIQPALTAADSAFIANNLKHSKASPSHLWAGGMVDYYYLTGDRDSLQAAIDVAEQCQNYFDWQVSGTDTVGTNARFQARCWLNFQRVWEATGTPAWLTMANQLRSIFLQATTYDQRGFYYSLASDAGSSYAARYPNGKTISPFQMGSVVQAMYHDWAVFGNQQIHDRLLQIAAFALANASDPGTGATGDYMVVDSPKYNTVLHVSYSLYRNAPPIIIPNYSSSSNSWIDALAVGYRLNGNSAYLDKGKALWASASKRLGVDPYTQVIADSTHVGRFMNSLQGYSPEPLLFHDGGDLTTMQLFFYDAARLDAVPPNSIRDLRMP